MGKALIIAEKPSVAADIARALGGFKKTDDHYESDQFVLSSAVGHLLELSVPEEFEVKRGKWTFTALPHLPPRFALAPIEKNENRLKALAKLIKRKDVDRLINACDAGREGELIFRNIAAFTHATQPVQRLWLQSMTPAAIRDGFARLRADQDMLPLSDASRCRAEADWLVGINGTRAMTAFNNKSGGFNKTPVGRVQTPTLAIVVEREHKIREFVSRDYWEVIATFSGTLGNYPGRWFDEKFVRPDGKDADPDLRADRIWEAAKAEAIRTKCVGKLGTVTEESKPTTQLSPLLFDLTSLQREGNSRFGFSAKTTLSLAQALYERHKVLTYPRTDSRHLPEDYPETVKKTLDVLRGAAGAYAPFAGRILQEEWVRGGNKRVFNNAKVSDHFAIIPTPEVPKHLTEAEQKIYDMVTRRFLAVLYPAAEFLETVRITRVEEEPFKSVGKVLVKAGWLEIYGKDIQNDGDAPVLTPVKPGEQVHTTDIEVKQSQTKPPPRYSEATLLSAMEGAGKLVEDDELREAMAEKGLGTPATRAQIIEGLIEDHYLIRQGRELQPTAKAFSLMVLLNGLGVETLTKPELTGEWEHKLKLMERGRLQRDVFMTEIRDLTEEIVTRAKSYDNDTIPGDFGKLTIPCPKCGGDLHETYKTFQCQKCDWSLYKIILGRQFEPEEVEDLIRNGRVGPLRGFRSKLGRPFDAMMKLGGAPAFKTEFDFGNGGEGGEGDAAAPPPDFTGQTPLGKCPKCGSPVFDTGMKYVCEKSVGPSKSCTFNAAKIILQQTIEHPQMQKLLAEGKTDLLKEFVSKRNGRKFEAFLVVKEGKVSFEFAPRAARPKAAKKSAAPSEPVPKIDFTGQTAIGLCPLCQGKVFESPDQFLCENSQRDARPCKFKSGRVILDQPIEREQMVKLLREGRTDLLDKFISRKSGKPFGAFLVLGEKGKVNFEFPER
ncbi:MAG: DNA topoisomerase III [Verrucomicrobiales bacterium]|nr:DNA topoisomerase III [Verrucomicrobiales bacterium]